MLRHFTARKRLAQVCTSQLKTICRLRSSNTGNVSCTPQIQQIQSSDSASRFLCSYDTFLLDCDGVLWTAHHDNSIPGIPKAIETLHKLGKKVLYVTNNSIISRISLREKFQLFGFDSSMDNIFSNGHSSAVYIKDILNVKGKVYLVGGKGMSWELDQEELDNFGVGPDPDEPSSHANDMLKMKFEDNVEAVLVGFDHHLSYNKIFKAASYLTNPNCHFIATNDMERGTFIGDNNDRRMPMTGMIVNAISVTSNRTATVVGKPQATMFECLVDKHPDIVKSRTVMIGDTLKADMGFAKSVGIDSALVLTGTNTLEQVQDMPHLMPEYVLNSLADIGM